MRNPRAQWGGSPGGQWVLVVMCSHGLPPPFGRIEAPGEERGGGDEGEGGGEQDPEQAPEKWPGRKDRGDRCPGHSWGW